jgi:hypothetical protein
MVPHAHPAARAARRPPPAPLSRWRWRLVALLLLAIVGSIGCNPAMLAFFLMPQDPKCPPDFSLTESKKDPKVVIVASHGGSDTLTTDLFNADRMLAEQLTIELQKRYKENGDRVKIEAPYKVQEYKARHADWDLKTPVEVGKHFGADYVINLEITRLSLCDPQKHLDMYFWQAEIHVTVTDVNGPKEQGPVFTKNYVTSFPETGPVVADCTLAAFRARFIQQMARDLSCMFASHPTEAKSSF